MTIKQIDYVISASYGNDSMAYEQGLKNVVVAYCDTGCASPVYMNYFDVTVTDCPAHEIGEFIDTFKLDNQVIEKLNGDN